MFATPSPATGAGGSRSRGTAAARRAALAVLAATAAAAWTGRPAAADGPLSPTAGTGGPGEPTAVLQAGPGDTVADAEEIVEEARSRQRAFERLRRLRLPYGGGPSAGRCDEVVGRYCLWHEDGGGDPEPPEEPESVKEGRRELLSHLEAALRSAPGSGWLLGQRVRYLLEAGRAAAALEEVEPRRCGAATWWCRALEGRVLHEQGRYVEAGSAFDRALAAMDAGRRRRWTDVGVLLEGEAADRWEASDPVARRRLAARLWRLADPLHLVPGNDRRTEHLARRAMARIRRDAATPFDRYWSDGLEELLLRYGLPVSYRREPPRPGRSAVDPVVTGRHPPGALAYLPGEAALLRPGRAGPEGWDLDADRPRATYAPAYADTVRRLPHRLTVFGRGDSSVVVAAYRASAGDGRADDGRPPEALLRLQPVTGPDAPAGSAAGGGERRGRGARGGLAVTVPSRPHVASVEVLHRDTAVAERARYGLRLSRRPEGVPGLSGLLLLEGGEPVPGTLSEAVPRALPPGPVRPGRRLGLYWEMYGPRSLLEDVEVSVGLAEADGSWLERLVGAVGLGEPGGEGVGLEWRDAAGRPGRVHPRGVRLRLPDDLPAGDYRLEVAVRVPGHEVMTSGHEIDVREAGPR